MYACRDAPPFQMVEYRVGDRVEMIGHATYGIDTERLRETEGEREEREREKNTRSCNHTDN